MPTENFPTFTNIADEHEPTYIHLSPNTDGSFRVIEPDTKYEESYTVQSRLARAAIQAFPADTAGLNLERLNSFREEIGATKKPIQFLEPSAFQAVMDKIRTKRSEPSGIYFQSLGMAVVRRDFALEALNGTAITESFAAHEAAHSSHIETPIRLLHRTRGRFFKKSEVVGSDSRNGYSVMPLKETGAYPYGYYFEEGYAEFERGLYVQKHGLVEQFTEGASNYALVAKSAIPLHYLYKQPESKEDKQGSLTFPPGALAATVLGILIEQDGSLLPTLRQGRKDVEGLRKTAQSINNLMPGLYSELQHADNEDTMVQLARRVIKRF